MPAAEKNATTITTTSGMAAAADGGGGWRRLEIGVAQGIGVFQHRSELDGAELGRRPSDQASDHAVQPECRPDAPEDPGRDRAKRHGRIIA
jgi:hypothetical protein